jgi:NAD(P)-dependent dehydrogenase (short-subunit alcohol dehydrogenase family)
MWSTCPVVFHPGIGWSSPPLPFGAYTPPQPGASCKEPRNYTPCQRIVVFCSKTAGTPSAVESPIDVFPPGLLWPYGAMKAALTHYMSSLSSTLAPQDIRVNTVTAGSIYYPGGVCQRREQEDPACFQKMVAQCRLGRLGRPEEVANAVVFLASPAASYITGTNLMVDGALIRRVQF